MNGNIPQKLQVLGEAFLSSIEVQPERPRKRLNDDTRVKSETSAGESTHKRKRVDLKKTGIQTRSKIVRKQKQVVQDESKAEQKRLHQFRKEVERFGVRGFSQSEAKSYLEDKWISSGGKKTPGKPIPKNLGIKLWQHHKQQKRERYERRDDF